MKDEGAPWLANVLAEVGPQHGAHVTNALPGKAPTSTGWRWTASGC